MAKYEIYQTQVETHNSWIKLIPKEWQVVPLKYMCNGFVKDGPHETPKFIDEGIPFLSVDGIQNNKLVFEGCRYISIEDDARFSLKCKPQKGNILLGKAASVGKVAFVENDYDFNVWSPLAVISPKDIRLGKFIFYCLQSYELQLQCDVFSNSNTQKNLGMTTIDNLTFPYPSISEAQNIANFLDHETAQIDILIAKQEKLIELLKEKRQAVISHAVTKGLNPDVTMKDSGVEWLGEVPEHWTVSKFKYFASIQGGFAFSSDLFIEEGTQVLRIGNVYQNSLSLERQPIFIANDLVKNFQDFIVKKNDVLMSLTGTLGKRDYGFAIKVETDDQYLLNQRVAKISPNKNIDTDFMVYVLWSESYLTQLYSLPSGTKQANLSNSDVLGIEIVVPQNMQEQKEIARYIKEKLEKFDEMIAKAKSAIQLMQERRTALISSAVTGKIDLRNWQNPNNNNEKQGL